MYLIVEVLVELLLPGKEMKVKPNMLKRGTASLKRKGKRNKSNLPSIRRYEGLILYPFQLHQCILTGDLNLEILSELLIELT